MPTITGTNGNDLIEGSDGDDVIFGLGGNDTINAGDGNDVIDSGSGTDVVNGGAGQDTLVASSVSTGFPAPPVTSFDGGSGIDTFDFSRISLFPQAFWSFDSSNGTITVANYQLRNVERLIGTSGRDIFNFFNLTNAIEIDGGAGDDLIAGSGLSDRLIGGQGNDEIEGRGGADFVDGGSGNDVIKYFQVSASGAIYDGGAGIDTLDFTDVRVDIDLSLGRATGSSVGAGFITVANIENVTVSGFGTGKSVTGNGLSNIIKFGSIGDDANMSVTFNGEGGDDFLYGSNGSDTLRGGTDNDLLDGRSGADSLFGDEGADQLRGGAGDDLLDGGDGVDTALFDDLQNGGLTASLIDGRATSLDGGSDLLINIENVVGSDLSDNITGNNQANRLEGRSGSDILRGGGGNDYLDGGSSADELYGDDGDDILVGGSSDDRLDGGAGSDTAVFTSTLAASSISVVGNTIVVDGPQGRDVLSNIEFLQFSDRTVSIGADGRIQITGTAGNDTLVGSAGNDRLTGGDGDDTLNGGAGDDIIDGGAGRDRFIMSGMAGTVDLNVTTAQDTGHGRDVLVGIEDVTGTAGNDTLIGDGNANALDGGAGNDVLTGGFGNDTIIGGAGFDIAAFAGLRSASTINYAGGIIFVNGPNGDDTLQSVESVQFADGLFDVRTDGTVATSARVTFAGTANVDVVRSGDSNDILQGGAGNDVLDAGIGTDRLDGGTGNDILTGGAGDDVIEGGTGTDTAVFTAISTQATFSYVNGAIVVDGPDGRDVLTGIEQLRFSDRVLDIGADGRVITALNTVNGTAAADTLTGTSGSDALLGGTGNDVLRGQGGSDLLNGGDGVDAAAYSGVRRQYGANITSVSGGPEGGTDTLVAIEEARFVDGVLSFDIDGIAAQVMRLYDATLDRQPDQAGLDVQIRALATGATTLQGLANAFVASGEFQNRYGTLSNQQFVEQLYRFSLDREGDAAGIAVQVNALNTGTSRAALVVAFSESPEHRTLTQPILNAGLWVADEKALQIARLYDATLDRLPDAAGLAGQLAALNGGTSLLQLAANFVGSAEFQARYGALSNQQFVEQLYRFCLDREGDAPGIAAQVNALNSGTSRAQLVLAFSESAEHVALTAPLYSGGIRTSDLAFNAAPVQDESGKPIDGQPLVLVQADDALPVTKAEDAQVLPGTVSYDPAQIVVGFKLVDDAFVLPAQDDLTPLVLPEADVLDTVALEQVSLPSLSGDRMLTLHISEDGTPDDATPWHRGTDTDGWMMQ